MTQEEFERLEKENAKMTENIFDSLSDKEFDVAIQKGIDQSFAEMEPEDVFQGQWIDQSGHPCDPPPWIEEVNGVKRIKKD